MAEDELEPLITECPSCHTRFRVTEGQLQVAKGRVRCGACLTVFQGVERLVWDDETQMFGSEQEAQEVLDQLLSELGPAPDEVAAHGAGAPDLDLDQEHAWTRVEAPADGRSAPTSAAESASVQPAGAGTRAASMPLFGGFEQASGAAPRDADSPARSAPAPMAEASGVTAEVAGADAEDAGAGAEDAGADSEDLQAAADALTDAAETARVDITFEGVAGGIRADGGDAETIGANAEAAEPDAVDAGGIGVAAPATDVDAAAQLQAAEAPATASGSAPAPAVSVARAEVQAKTHSEAEQARAAARDAAAAEVLFGEPRRARPLVWLGIVLASLALVAQVLYYRFDDWAHEPLLEPVYRQACAVLGCELPARKDLARLSTRNLLVRSDPNRPGMLEVNAVIVNEADFAQPFPTLELRFTSIRGALVSGNRFEPEQYLAGEASGMLLMPPRTPVQIQLEIDDPGADAVNYLLKFL